MGAIVSYKDLIVWQRSIELVKEIYRLTKVFPKDELYGIVSQMRRAVVSIPSNIAEGFGRKTKRDSDQFYCVAYASGLELETQLIISRDLLFVSLKEFQRSFELLSEVLKMLNKMTNQYRNTSH